MNIVQIEENVKQLIHKISKGELHRKEFIYELLLAYGHRSQSIGRVRNGERNLAEDKENTVFWKRQIYFKIAKQHNLHGLIYQMKGEKRTESNKIRFLIVTDFKNLLAIDTKTQDTLDVPFGDLAKKFDFFLPWAGMEKAVYQGENPADVKAAEKLAKLFDEIKADNFDEDDLNNKDNLHQLNIFLSRLLFCYFAEDTEIFKDKQFTSAISKSNEDGSDLSALIGRLFKVLNQSDEDREADLPDYLADFPYVNGGLFKDDIQVPKFTRKSRRILIECGAELDWSDINPDIFGSMFQAVVHTEQRSTMGQHYTSVPNIMKVIEPLFLNDLYEELEKNQDSVNKLLKLQQRLGQLKIFDPACGSGNFLIIAYKELRKFEMELLKRIQELELEKTGQFSKPFSVIQVSQFYGIEVDDFAHEIAILSLWLVEHQMNLVFKDEFGESLLSLPLKHSGNIIAGNALRIDWNSIFSNSKLDQEIFILGNPPYLGFAQQTVAQKEEIKLVWGEPKKLDYISCWFLKASQLITAYKGDIEVGFVSTNSITQGEQVSVLWPSVLVDGVNISFCHTSFQWRNSARSNAGVYCVIIGLSKKNKGKKLIYSESTKNYAEHITPYLTSGKTNYILKRRKPLSQLPEMKLGEMAKDGGNLFLTKEEVDLLKNTSPKSLRFIKEITGADEFIRGNKRWCIWVNEEDYEIAKEINFFQKRFEKVVESRLSSPKLATKEYASKPFRFVEIRGDNVHKIMIPTVSSSRRDYIPLGFFDENTIVNAPNNAIYDAEPYIFSVIQSKMHMAWVKAIGGKLKTDYRYSVSLIYNTFPFPSIDNTKKELLTLSAIKIIEIREKVHNLTISDLYDPNRMPTELKCAHDENDKLVDSCYRKQPFQTDEERLDYLFLCYEEMIERERNND